MPLLEIVQTTHINATIRLEESTAALVDQYAAFLHAAADEVVDKALAYVFAKDRDFQDFLRTPEAAHVPQSLRIRRFSRMAHPPSLPTAQRRLRNQRRRCMIRARAARDRSGLMPVRCCAPGLFRHSIPGRVLPMHQVAIHRVEKRRSDLQEAVAIRILANGMIARTRWN